MNMWQIFRPFEQPKNSPQMGRNEGDRPKEGINYPLTSCFLWGGDAEKTESGTGREAEVNDAR